MGTIKAFTARMTCKLAKISQTQLKYWQEPETAVFAPEYAVAGEPYDSEMMYSFQDVVALRTLSTLRDDVSLQELRKVYHWLRARYGEPWAGAPFLGGCG